MSKIKLFIENFLVYGLGGIISKIIPLVMVPLVAKLMPDTKYFGISDMSQTVIQFGSALAVLGMYDAMFRLFFEKGDDKYKKKVCSTAMIFTVGMSLLVFISMVLLRKQLAIWFLRDGDLQYVIYLSAMATLVSATNSIIAAPTRMQNKRKVFLVTNTLSPLISYGISIPLLLKGFYAIALPVAGVISGITMELAFYFMNREWFEIKLFDRKLLKQLLVIAIPLFPNFLIYWLFNSSDRVMITNLIDVGAEGVYSVGSKLGHASQLIYTAFAGGWQFFSFSTMREKNQIESNSNIFEYLGIISFLATSFICIISHFVYRCLFTGEYVGGYIIAPYLFLAPLLQMLFQVECNQFVIIKKTWPNMLILFLGAMVNVFLNFTLIPLMGIEGAAIATLIGYVISVVVATVTLCRTKLMFVKMRFIFASICMGIFFVIWRQFASQSVKNGLCLFFAYLVIALVLYRIEIKAIINRIMQWKRI